jgi:hypothetical protein
MNQRRTVRAFYTTGRHQAPPHLNISALTQQESETGLCRAEFDTHADTCGINNVACILSYTEKTAHVSPFTLELNQMKDKPIVKAALAYDDSITGETFVIIVNQAIYFGNSLPHILLHPNQMRAHGVQVEDVPKYLSQGKSSHSIYFEEEKVRILRLNGYISYFSVRTPNERDKRVFKPCSHFRSHQMRAILHML